MSTEAVKLIPKGIFFHPQKNCKNFWDIPVSPGLYKLWSALKIVFATILSHLELIWRWHVYSHRLTYGPSKCFQGLSFSVPVVPLHSCVHLRAGPYVPISMQGFHASFWIWIMKTLWSELQKVPTPDIARDTAMILPDLIHRNHLTNL